MFQEIELVAKVLPTVRTGVWLLSRMDFLMRNDLRLVCEALAAFGARVQHLARVDPLMLNEV